jgi:hypothetical protein
MPWKLDEKGPSSVGAWAAGRAGDGPDLLLAHGGLVLVLVAQGLPALTGRYRVH